MLLRRQEPGQRGRHTKRGFVYLMASKRNGTLYLKVTSDLPQRCHQHREGLAEGFSKRYGCRTLVWYEVHDDLQEARLRELQIKKWKRAWKVRLIHESNADWIDLWPNIAA